MLDLWTSHSGALYAPEHAHLLSGPCGGHEATQRYLNAIQNFLPPNARIHFLGNFEVMVAGPDGEKWDQISVVMDESLQGFREMVQSHKYKAKLEPQQLAGLEEWRLVAMGSVGKCSQ